MVKQHQGLSGILAGGAVILLATQPVCAAATQVTAVRLNPTSGGMDIVLETQGGDRPQVFTVSRGSSWTADITNTQLRLAHGKSFRQDNPAPGITSVTITPLDANSIRVTVAGQGASPAGQLSRRDARGLVLSLSQPAGGGTARSTPATPSPATTQAQAPAAQAPTSQALPSVAQAPAAQPPAQTPTAQTPTAQTPTAQTPTTPPAQVPLVPNPESTIQGTPVPAPRTNVAPPFLPRAIAPPVGDIAVSNIDVSPAVIDLGSAERVPRLVLRDAPVRDVLALLARAAGLNVAFTEGAPTTATPGAAATAAAATAGPTISLDIENEPVQDVFNYVLRLTGLEANRVGRTIFIGQNLPTGARGLVMRTLRLNQIQATLPLTQITNTETSASSLTSGGGQGASTTNSQVGRTSTATQNVPIRGALQILEELGANGGGTTAGQPGQAGAATANTSQLLRGLQVTADSRTNSITLLGPANLIELATSHLAQLDVRRRQVAVNVKIVEVDLANQANLGASFSFGVANNFFSVDQGQFTGGVGSFRPPTGAEARGSLTGQVVAPNPYATATTFIDPNGPGITVNAGEGTQIIQANGTVTTIPRTTTFNSRTVPLDNPFTGGLTEITQGTPDQITFNPDGTASFSRGTVPTATAGLPSLFQFPKDFLLRLQAQVVNGNAKILTDPTLIVQEGSQSQVNLTQQVFSGFTESRVTEGTISTTRVLPGAPIDVGVILNVQVDRVDDNGFVTMSLSPEVSSPGQQILDPSRNNLLIQQLVNRRRLETGNIRLRDGQTLILTGIIQEQDRTVTTKTPILGDLPLIGALFRSTNRQNNRNEVIVLVTPQIMDDSDRSTFGYNYTPGPEARQILQQRGSRN